MNDEYFNPNDFEDDPEWHTWKPGSIIRNSIMAQKGNGLGIIKYRLDINQFYIYYPREGESAPFTREGFNGLFTTGTLMLLRPRTPPPLIPPPQWQDFFSSGLEIRRRA